MNVDIKRHIGSAQLLSDLVVMGIGWPDFPAEELNRVEASAAALARWILERGEVPEPLQDRIAACLPGIGGKGEEI